MCSVSNDAPLRRPCFLIPHPSPQSPLHTPSKVIQSQASSSYSTPSTANELLVFAELRTKAHRRRQPAAVHQQVCAHSCFPRVRFLLRQARTQPNQVYGLRNFCCVLLKCSQTTLAYNSEKRRRSREAIRNGERLPTRHHRSCLRAGGTRNTVPLSHTPLIHSVDSCLEWPCLERS